jgi:hypothetical protein
MLDPQHLINRIDLQGTQIYIFPSYFHLTQIQFQSQRIKYPILLNCIYFPLKIQSNSY